MPKKKVGEILKIDVTITLWIILVIGVIALLIGYFCNPSWRDQIKFTAIVLGGAAAIYSAYYVGTSLRLKLESDKQQRCFELLNQLNRPEFIQVRTFLEKEVEGHKNIAPTDLYEKVTCNHELYGAVRIVLGILEDMSIAVQSQYVDEEILYMSMDFIVRGTYSSLRGYIEMLRERKNDPILFVEFEKLANAWNNKIRLSDGKKLPALSAA